MSDDKVAEVAKRNLTITMNSFTMFAVPRIRTSKKQLRLSFACTNGYPNVNMETDEEGEPSKENNWLKLSARLNATNFYVYLSLIKKAITQAPGWKSPIECYHTYKDGVFHEKGVHVCDLSVGVDNQGLVYTTILQAGRTGSKYVFGPTEWHNYKDTDGNNLSQKEINQMCAMEFANGLSTAMSAALALDAVDFQNSRTPMTASTRNDRGDDSQKPAGNGYNNGGGGFQKKPWNGGGGGNGGGFQKKPWENRGGGQGGGGGYQKKPWDGGGGGGGYQKKPWDGGQQNNRPAAPAPAPAPAGTSDYDDLDI